MAEKGKKRKSLNQTVFLRTKKSFLSSFKWVAIFASITLLCFLLFAYLGAGLLSITIFIILPLCFAINMMITDQILGYRIDARAITYYFSYYFRFPFRGVYRAISTSLKSIVFFLLTAFIVLMTLLNLDPNLNESLNYAYTSFTSSQYGQLLTEINHNPSLHNFFYLAYGLSYGVGAIVFLFLMLFNTLNCQLRRRVHADSSREANHIFSKTISEHRWEIYPKVLQLGWPILALFAFGYAGGLIIFFDLVRTPASLVAISLSFGLLLSTPAILYYFVGLPYIWSKTQFIFFGCFLEMVNSQIAAIMREPLIDNEALKSINEAKEGLNELYKKLKEKEDDLDADSSDPGKEDDDGPWTLG